MLLKHYLALAVLLHSLLLCSGIHPNPGPPDGTNYCDITISHSNIRSLKSTDKRGTLEKLLYLKCNYAERYDIITVSETWLTKSFNTDQFCINGYQKPFRKDRENDEGYGGVMAWVANQVACKRHTGGRGFESQCGHVPTM